MKLFEFVIIRLTLCLIIGIILGNYTTPSLLFSLSSLGILICFTIVIIKKKNVPSYLFGILTSFIFIALGNTLIQLHHPNNQKNHYSKLINSSTNYKTVLKISDVLKPTPYQQRYYANVISINNNTATGKVLVHIKRDSIKTSYKTDDVLLLTAVFNTIKKPLNPGGFNYKKYLEKQYVFNTINTSSNYVLHIKNQVRSVKGYAHDFRERIIKNLKKHPFSKDELAIINALFLGKRNDINVTTLNKYSDAGAIHILAISGLHIGILLLFLNLIFKPLECFKNGALFKTGIIVILLWCIAFITGLSPSVMRAVTMFSILQFTTVLKRPSIIYNTLAVSAFVLLITKPILLFDVGFQLSYTAVIAIVTIQPLAIKLWCPKNKIVNYFWNILAVSIAAQIGVFPLSLFYFHKFAGLFWLTNLLIIPIIGVVLSFGFLIIVFSFFSILPIWLSSSFSFLIRLINTIIYWVSGFEKFIFNNLHFNLAQTVISYLIILFSIQFIIKKRFYTLVLILVSIIFYQSEAIINYHFTNTNEFVIFNSYTSSIIGIKNKKELDIFSNTNTYKTHSILKNYSTKNAIKSINHKTLSSLYKINGDYLMVVDSLGLYTFKSINPNYVLLRSSPKINLNRLLKNNRPTHIIADGSNYNSYIKRWKQTCLEKNIPFHYTNEKGAFIINLGKK